jgi:catechol 2,3-dioxygenase
MALNGVLRPGYIQIRVTDMDAALRHYFDRVGLHEVGRELDGRAYLRAWDEFDRHSIVLRPAETPGIDYVGFKVASETDLDAFARRIEASGTKVKEVPAGEQPGLGRRLSFVVPTGQRVEAVRRDGAFRKRADDPQPRAVARRAARDAGDPL